VIVIGRPALRIIVDACEAAVPAEACGLLIGRVGIAGRVRVTGVEPARNVAADPVRAFEVDPGLRIGLERELRPGPLAIVGHYHSHPAGPARPSATDAARVIERALVWLIVGLEAGQAVEIGAFRPVAGPAARASPFRRLELVTVGGEAGG